MAKPYLFYLLYFVFHHFDCMDSLNDGAIRWRKNFDETLNHFDTKHVCDTQKEMP